MLVLHALTFLLDKKKKIILFHNFYFYNNTICLNLQHFFAKIAAKQD